MLIYCLCSLLKEDLERRCLQSYVIPCVCVKFRDQFLLVMTYYPPSPPPPSVMYTLIEGPRTIVGKHLTIEFPIYKTTVMK